ncbi:hypothetical protein ZL58_23410, partial [Salmonella enterica subsp. enterica serovar Typhimurium]|nr:hypothetical protein [Salmonella enterica subsp. enterica serovar Typhimurium]
MMIYIHSEPQHPKVEIAQDMLDEISELSGRDKPDLAVARYQLFIKRFEDNVHPEVQVPVARVMLNRAVASGDAAKALAEYGRLIARFGDSAHP